MKRHLFLVGPENCGKSALIRSMLGKRMEAAGGFVTEKKFDANGKLLGVDLIHAAAAAGIEGYEPVRFLDYTKIPPKSDNEVFRNMGTQLLEEAQYYPFVVMDEFGGIDLLIPQYRAVLQDILNSSVPCIGVMKSPEAVIKLRNDFGLTERFSMLTDNLQNVLKADADTSIIQTTGKGDVKTLRIIQQWVFEYA